MNIKKTTICATVLIAAILMMTTSCASKIIAIPDDATPAQLIQIAQSSYDNGNTNYAIYCYETMLLRYGETDLESYVIAQYEIAHLLVRDGKPEEAKPRLEEILFIYDDETAARILPAEYRKLAENELNRISTKK